MADHRATAATQSLIRPLDLSEEVYASFGSFVGYCVRATGHIDVAAMTRALAQLRSCYPVLATRIVPLGTGRHAITAERDDADPTYVTVTSGRGSPPLRGLTMRQQDQVCAVHIAEGEGDTTVAFFTHHSVADGQHSLVLLTQLWSMYTDIVAGRPSPTLTPHPYPESAEALLLARGYPDATSSGSVPLPCNDISDTAGANDAASAEFIRLRLTPAQTTQLISNARSQHTTVNGVISAALILAEAQVSSVDMREIAYMYTVDLRSRLNPPVGLTEGTNVIAPVFATGADVAGDGMYEMARKLNAKLAADLDRGMIAELLGLVAALSNDEFPELPAVLTPGKTLSSTNWGRIPELVTPPSVSLIDFHPASYQQWQSPQGLDIPGLHMTESAYITTFNGSLAIDFASSDNPDLAAARAAATRQLLTPEDVQNVVDDGGE
uniref:phthiocerol/phthiodiolone dimycocerosyl transferase family protein n=1 Tax=Mycolicibacterium obuense TaxID=1807 RepID=UPI003F58057E